MKTRFLALLSGCLACLAAVAADWPQWRGSDRTGVSRENDLLKDWPKKGLPLLWTFKNAGIGFSGPAVVGDRLYTMGARKDADGKETEYLIAIDVSKGTELWSVAIGPIFAKKGNSYGDGPRGTPTVDGDQVYALGGQGELIAVNLPDHRVLWRTNLEKNLGGKLMNIWGYCESPLVDGAQVVCCPGGAEGTVAALDKKSGQVIWRTKDLTEDATFGSAVIAEFGGVRQYVTTTFKGSGMGGHIVGIAAKDGKLLWSFEQPKFDDVDVCATPIVQQDYVYVSAGRQAGSVLLQITKGGSGFKVKQLYTKLAVRKVMDNEHGGVVLVGNHLYGFTEARGKAWVCQDLKTGAAVWTSKKVGKGCLTCAGGQLYLYSEDEGQVVLIDATEQGWKEHGRFEIPMKSKVSETRKSNSGAKIWTHPVVANGRLYLRDQEYLFCYKVKQ
jgi:outer membrane protein assembly factor BamB